MSKKKPVKLNKVDITLLEILYQAKDKPVGFYEEEGDLKQRLIIWCNFSENQVNYSIKKLMENDLIMESKDKLYRITWEGSEALETAMVSNILKEDREIYTLPENTNEVMEHLQKSKLEFGGHIDVEKGDNQPERFFIRKGKESSVFIPDDSDFEIKTHTHPTGTDAGDYGDFPSSNDIEAFCRSVQQVDLIYHDKGIIVLEKMEEHPEKMEKRNKTAISGAVDSWSDRHNDDFWNDKIKYNQDFAIYLRNRYGIRMTKYQKGETPRMKLKKV